MDLFYPIQLFSDWLTFGLLNLDKKSIFGSSLNFFIYDSVKILILLIVIIFLVSFLRSYLSQEKMRKLLTKKYLIIGNVLAALFGIITPFCSCSAVPLFIGFVESGVPLGVTFSYLISAPMVNEVAVILLFGLFGLPIALLYAASGITIAIVVGFLMGRMNLEHLVVDYVWKIKAGSMGQEQKPTFKERVNQAYIYTFDLVKKVFLYVLIGVGIGALIHGYAPEKFLAQIAGKGNILAVPLAVLVGVPLYSNAAGTIPIVKSLIEKGLPLGTALAFMMSVTALSFPEMVILRKVLKLKLLGIYIAILSLGIIFTGYLFNLVI
ncbi:MAG: hypothetical protein CO135_00210 [Candidatus Levybacteria bacterium CG_4_9_14_3_um_filter_35_16]|nr:MAG: hypothetical protein COW87_01335 [Candidatus Levybacteria bacterium CG22_combo_CG10-13_8_21_14_all_35_11]PJA91641.1 MAG: hypothetical protein CO135_00210 [Candidatus Levybacteria bacterium CG_4_9_14_3_um_filter_35_16]PJC54630.1 MAG: hypothetical protein CO028_01335 [Candidatus Levybacteria bacterium CG_4_9_14_0_2_um_filter_35_21]